MTNHRVTHSVSLFSSLIALSLFTATLPINSSAANVPEGTQLAKKQEFVRSNGAEPATLDPHKVEGVPESNIVREMFEGLLIQDADGNLLPGVAESWETSDNQVYTFKLRDTAKWSNGDPVTAEDFVYSFRRVVDPATASPYAWFLEMAQIKNSAQIIKGEAKPETLGVKALDEHTLEITLESPLPYFINMTAHTTMVPAHRATVEKYGDKWTSPENIVSNGAYKLSNWVVNEKIEMVRNEQYWDNEHTVVNKVTFLPIENQVTDMNRFLAGDTDMTYEMPLEHFKRLKKEHPESVKVTPYLCSYYYEFNNEKAPFDDVRVRKALSYAINRDIITDNILGMGQLAAYNFAHQKVAGFKAEPTDYSQMTQAERDAKAKALLEEAGFGADKPLSFTLLYNTSENHKKIAVAVAAIWKKTLGVAVKLENQEWKTFLETRTAGNHEVARAGWCGDYNEASTFLSLMQSNNGNNHAKYYSDEYDQIMKNALSAKTTEERSQLYAQAEQLLAKDMPIAPIYHYVNARLVSPKVGGYPMNNAEDNIYSKDLYMIAE
ncbi:MAG: oligopeptide ABC transporter substrate-binding protein OppA [Proteobacteria bacterium]|nr:MAG: oligopeptide ABC transporter substrate-binding protein OppA [Pseudomonadota bacterium]